MAVGNFSSRHLASCALDLHTNGVTLVFVWIPHLHSKRRGTRDWGLERLVAATHARDDAAAIISDDGDFAICAASAELTNHICDLWHKDKVSAFLLSCRCSNRMQIDTFFLSRPDSTATAKSGAKGGSTPLRRGVSQSMHVSQCLQLSPPRFVLTGLQNCPIETCRASRLLKSVALLKHLVSKKHRIKKSQIVFRHAKTFLTGSVNPAPVNLASVNPVSENPPVLSAVTNCW